MTVTITVSHMWETDLTYGGGTLQSHHEKGGIELVLERYK